MRLVLARKRELADAADEAADADRAAALAFLRDDLERRWRPSGAPGAFADRVSSTLLVALRLAARYEAKYARESPLQRSTAIYQLLLAQFLDHRIERHVYKRCMDADMARDVDAPIAPVRLRSKVFALLVAAFLYVAPIYFLVVFGRQYGEEETWLWWQVAMQAIALIVAVVEPARILFFNFVLPKVLVPKMKHFHDPCQIADPFRAKLPTAPVDLIDARHVAETFRAARLPLPKRFKDSRVVAETAPVPEGAAYATLARPRVATDACGAPVRRLEAEKGKDTDLALQREAIDGRTNTKSIQTSRSRVERIGRLKISGIAWNSAEIWGWKDKD